LALGTPSKASIPTTVEQSIFCHECTVNQTLVTNMLANYLPLPSVSSRSIFPGMPDIDNIVGPKL
jgi:hypothetical protein